MEQTEGGCRLPRERSQAKGDQADGAVGDYHDGTAVKAVGEGAGERIKMPWGSMAASMDMDKTAAEAVMSLGTRPARTGRRAAGEGRRGRLAQPRVDELRFNV